MEIEFLTLDEVFAIHADQIKRYGGSAGIRDRGLLESALAMPQAQFGGVYLHTDIFLMAAAYLFHLAQNHAFIDGNKRVAAVTALLFLSLNGIELTATEEEFEELVWRVARGEIGKTGIAEFFRANSSQMPKN